MRDYLQYLSDEKKKCFLKNYGTFFILELNFLLVSGELPCGRCAGGH